jgi:hypothetical protein
MISRVDDRPGELQLIPGETYRRSSLHKHFGGQQHALTFCSDHLMGAGQWRRRGRRA